MRLLTGLLLLLMASNLCARSAGDYLPADTDPDPAIPTPESVLGWEVGDWHVSHDRLVSYMQVLADASDRVSLNTIGYSHEQRPLLQLVISSPDNLGNIEALRQQHLEGSGPLVVMLGYSIHGNEPSGSNAALLTAYYLAASRSAFVQELLSGSVVLIDPSLNPDGLNRFASWANSHAGRQPVADPNVRPHVEGWPSARTNHYWFDLNRDWLPLVHPESRARVDAFHHWLPHVLTDHHEQTGYPGFFFQPGVPTRQNPLTPLENLELTRALAQFHSKSMDRAGQPHFTEDAYDDFYYGKGSTYPDINGSVGILFEQKAIRGQALETSNGTETFRDAISNQLLVSLSTLEGAWSLRERLKAYQAGFHASMQERADSRRIEAWIVGDDGDPARARDFLDTLALHRIDYSPLAETVRSGDLEFRPGHAWVIPAKQRQFGLLEALMEQRTRFEDETFYDVSAWTLPLAYNLPFTSVKRLPAGGSDHPASTGRAIDRQSLAWAVPWNQLEAPALLQQLLQAGVRVRTVVKPFSAHTGQGLVAFAPGTLLVQAGIQQAEALEAGIGFLNDAALRGLEVWDLGSSLTAAGPDLGSRHFMPVEPIRPLIIGGQGVSAYDAGEQWYLLDQRLGMPAPVSEMQNLHRVDLSRYTHILMPDGDYGRLNGNASKAIGQWVRAGGILVASGRAAIWAESLCLGPGSAACVKKEDVLSESASPAPRPYGDFAADKAQHVIGGAIVAGLADLSHPLAFGYSRPEFPLFRRGTVELQPSGNPYATPVRYSADPLIAGFIGADRLRAMAGQAAVIAERADRGLVVRFANTPLFRAFWRGTERLFVNALYFGQIIEATDLPAFEPPPIPETPRQQ
jgi:hypothetical protein